MALALERPLIPSPRRPDEQQRRAEAPKLDVSVVFTSVRSTLRALEHAGALAHRLDAQITLVVPQLVPYPLPLTSPPVLLEYNERRFGTIARESRVETTVRIYLCRDRWETLARILKPHSLVVLGGQRRWWPTPEKRLAKGLRSLGHQVVFVETE